MKSELFNRSIVVMFVFLVGMSVSQDFSMETRNIAGFFSAFLGVLYVVIGDIYE